MRLYHSVIAYILSICFILFANQSYGVDIVFDIGQIVGGGDGRGSQLPGNQGKDAIDQRNGTFVSGNIFNSAHPSPTYFSQVLASPYIDGVFITQFTNTITSTGVSYDVGSNDKMMMYDYITYQRLADGNIFNISGISYQSGFGIHSGSGITFDIDAFRSISAFSRLTFESDFGLGVSGTSSNGVYGYAILSSASAVSTVIKSPLITSSSNNPYRFNFDIPSSTRFLTLISGQAGESYFDHSGFGNPTITGTITVPEPKSYVLGFIVAVFLGSVIYHRRNTINIDVSN